MCTGDSLPIGLLIYEKLSGLSSAYEMIPFWFIKDLSLKVPL